MAKDYYETLGVSKNSSKEEIKKAYKRLAKTYHPDNKETGDEGRFKEINEAASILGNEEKREEYDQFGDADSFKRASGQGGFDPSNFGFDFGDSASFDFGDIFDQFFGGGGNVFGGRQRRGRSQGDDLRYEMEIELEDAAFGTKKDIIIPRLEKCSKCHGTGAESTSDVVRCNICNGNGIVKQTRRTPFGIFATTTTCKKCHGTGEMIKNECNICDGEGRIEKERKIKVTIPAGVENGNQLRISGEGEAGERGADSGDLYVVMHINEHKYFERKGNDIFIEVPINFVQAALGDEVEVPTLKNKAKLKIPAGTQTGTLFRMKGKGIPSLHGHGYGNQFVKVKVVVPKKLNKKQKELLKEFSKVREDKGFLKGFFK